MECVCAHVTLCVHCGMHLYLVACTNSCLFTGFTRIPPVLPPLQCNTVCSSQAELREHRKTCPRTHRDSASTHSVSVSVSDVEVLSDTSESLTSDEEEEDVIQEELLPAPNRRGTNHPSPTREAVGGSKKGGEGEKGGRGKRRQRQKKKVGIPSVKSATNVKQTAAQKKTRMRKASSEAVRLGANNLSPPSDDPSPVLGVGGGEILNHQDVYFGVGSDSSESSDDEDDLEYTPAEMAQLLSLNELDMQPCSGSDSEENVEEEEEEEGEGEGGGAKEGGELREKKRRLHQSQNKEVASNSASGTDLDSQALPGRRVPRPQQRAVAHTRQPEPVGLFWDIENCSVPGSKSAFAVAAKMRRVFFECKREAEFMVVCDITKERKEVIDSLNKAQVCPSLVIDFREIHMYTHVYRMVSFSLHSTVLVLCHTVDISQRVGIHSSSCF